MSSTLTIVGYQPILRIDNAVVRRSVGKMFAKPGRARELYVLSETEMDRLVARLAAMPDRPRRHQSPLSQTIPCRPHGLIHCQDCEGKRRKRRTDDVRKTQLVAHGP